MSFNHSNTISSGGYRLYEKEETLILTHLETKKFILFDKSSGKISQISSNIDYESKVLEGIDMKKPILKPISILGVISISDFQFLLIVTQADEVCLIDHCPIYKVKEIDLIPLHNEKHSKENSDVITYSDGLRSLMSLGFFFSFNYHLTLTRQRIAKLEFNASVIGKAEEKYFWNYNLYQEFRENLIDDVFCTVLICGYVGHVYEYINNKEESETQNRKISKKDLKDYKICDIYLISRRSVNHAGTRYITRGIDDDGYVANYVETEQLVIYMNSIFSYVQVRGSAPIFFSQNNLSAQTEITRSSEMTAPAFTKHMKEVFNNEYSMMFMVNLMNQYKPGEQMITKNMEKQIRSCDLKNIKYFFFDFQTETKYENYDKLEVFTTMKNVKEVLDYFKFHVEDMNTKTITKEQTGIIRTNCLDCLDRTNVIQTRIAWRMIEIQLAYAGVNIESVLGYRFITNEKEKGHFLLEKFKNIWAEMGDYISIQYAGSASTITSITKHGKHGFFGLLQHGIATITRFYQGSFEDSFKQNVMELFLQKHKSSQVLSINPLIEEELKKVEGRFTQISDLKVYITSWNVGGSGSEEVKNIGDLFNKYSELIDHRIIHETSKTLDTNTKNINSIPPDIYVICLQEVVNLNANNLLLYSNTEVIKNWKNQIKTSLESIGKYTLLKAVDLIGLFMLVFVKSTLRENIKSLDTGVIRTGMLGTMGNKGSLIVKFNYNDTSIGFVCSHLTHGMNGNKHRINELHEILNKSFMSNNKEHLIRSLDYFYIIGDLNFRIDHDDTEIRNLISKGNLKQLFKYDQLISQLKKNSFFEEVIMESEIKFDPSYKYTVGTSIYDSAKKRSPAWCDRILFNKNKNIICQKYDSILSFCDSDHKPVFGVFNLKVSKIDYKERLKIINQIKKEGNYKNEGTNIECKSLNLILFI